MSAYYANGDYQYACRTDAITGKNTGITYLRIGKGGDTPNYEQVETRHDKTHPLDAPRVKYNADGSIPTPVVYTPLFNANNSGTEPMNDFLFWGQSLQHNPDNYPCDIASHQNSYMSNRVYRTAAYYGDTSLDAFHYNAYSNGSITMSTYVHDSATTAVDFTCLHDLPAATETVGGIFYPPIDDNASRFNDFVVRKDAGITQNLLVYTADNDENVGIADAVADTVEKTLPRTIHHGKGLKTTHQNTVGDNQSDIDAELHTDIIGKSLEHKADYRDQGGYNNQLHNDTDAHWDGLAQERDDDVAERGDNRHRKTHHNGGFEFGGDSQGRADAEHLHQHGMIETERCSKDLAIGF